jgi:hypothetical protein
MRHIGPLWGTCRSLPGPEKLHGAETLCGSRMDRSMPVLECFRRQPATAQGSDLGRLPVLGRASPQFRRQTHNRTRSAYVVNLKQVATSHWAVACPDLLEALVVARRGQGTRNLANCGSESSPLLLMCDSHRRAHELSMRLFLACFLLIGRA